MKNCIKLFTALSIFVLLITGCSDGGSVNPPVSVEPTTSEINSVEEDTSSNLPGYHTVRFNTNGGESISSVQVLHGEKVSKPNNPVKVDPVKGKYRFIEWQYQGEEWSFIGFVVTEDMTLDAVWEDKYEVAFDSKGGSSVSSQYINKGETATKPTNPTKNGYTFVNWTLYGDNYNFSSSIYSDITLEAKWNTVTYTITYNFNGGKVDSNNPSTYSVEDHFTFIEPTRAGYTFLGWFDSNDKEITEIKAGTTGNLVLTAHWEENEYETLTIQQALNIIEGLELSTPSSKEYRVVGTIVGKFMGFSNCFTIVDESIDYDVSKGMPMSLRTYNEETGNYDYSHFYYTNNTTQMVMVGDTVEVIGQLVKYKSTFDQGEFWWKGFTDDPIINFLGVDLDDIYFNHIGEGTVTINNVPAGITPYIWQWPDGGSGSYKKMTGTGTFSVVLDYKYYLIVYFDSDPYIDGTSSWKTPRKQTNNYVSNGNNNIFNWNDIQWK